MPSKTFITPSLQAEGPTLEVQFMIPVALEEQYRKASKPIPTPIVVKALIDTGASNCIIKDGIPQKLGLQPNGTIKINTPSSKNHLCYKYFMRMFLPSYGVTYEGEFTATALEEQTIESLIGRDLLQHGILIYTGNANQFTFSLL